VSIVKVKNMATIAPLFADWQENLARSTLDGCMGEAYANHAFTAAQIANGDFALLAGDAACAEAPELARNVPVGFRSGTLLVSAREESWHSVVEKAWGARARRGERFAIRKDANRFDPAALERLAVRLPDGIRLAAIDGELYHKALLWNWSRDFVSLFQNEADYLARGLGVMALADGEPVAGASSYVVFAGGIEIEIDTREDYRRRGLATACGAALMLQCFERGLYPSWDAANRASVSLAEKLGYLPDKPYVTYEISLS
jgi:GNAT superfamily N-acetyltransferase